MKKFALLISCLFFLVHFAGAFDAAHETPALTGFSPTGITVAGGNGPGSAGNQLMRPLGIFVDARGNIFIADQRNNRIQKWAPGASSGVTVAGGNGAGQAANQLDEPFDVFVDPAGNIYIDLANGAQIQKWAPGASSGVIVAGGNGRGSAANQLNDPVAIHLDEAGNIYIADQINSRIQKWAPGAVAGVTAVGNYGTGSAANQLSIPTGVFVDAAGNIYVSEGGNNRVQKWAPGAITGITVAGGNGPGSAPNQVIPTDVFVDQAGNVFVVDRSNHRIQKWAPGATAGITVAGGNGQGSAPNQLDNPYSVFIDQQGYMYVSDDGNNRIQKFTPDQLTSCLPNLIFTAPSCNGSATVSWAAPHDTFPSSIAIPEELDLSRGMLTYMGAQNRHGYYKSSLAYLWPVAKDIAFYIGDTSVNGHLIVISSAAENNFIFNQLKGSGYSPWIGLYNTGKPGQFGWVNGASLSYTNWASDEPSNAPGNARNVKEPYVRLLDGNGTWNDQRSDNVPFITEFEEPLIRYRQISGPANGSSQSPGTYQVCYEKTNMITDEKDTCCFSITVNCTTSASNVADRNSAQAILDKNNLSATNGGLSISTSPNPSSNYFKFKITSSRRENKVDVLVTDVLGKVVESRKGLMPDQTFELGSNYRPGIYFAQVIQGSNKVMLRMVKQ